MQIQNTVIFHFSNMAANKKLSSSSYLVRRHYSSSIVGESYTQSTRRYSGIELYPRRDMYTPPIAYEVTRKFPDSMRASSLSRDRSSLSVDRQMYSRGFSQAPADKALKQANTRMAISRHRFDYS